MYVLKAVIMRLHATEVREPRRQDKAVPAGMGRAERNKGSTAAAGSTQAQLAQSRVCVRV